jgi:hypothetical protein
VSSKRSGNRVRKLICLFIPGSETEVEERQFNWPGFGGISSGGCNRYEVISARGTGELQAFPTGNRGTVDGILGAVSGGSNYEVMYPGKWSCDPIALL